MLRTLFYIPTEIAGVPVFGALLVLWIVFSVGLLAWLVWRQGPSADTWSHVPLVLIVGGVIYWVLPALSEPAGLPIRSYGVMLLAAVLLGGALAVWRGRRAGLSADVVLSLIFWMFVPGIVGARVFYVIEYWPAYHRDTLAETLGAIVNVAEGGLVVYGSLVGGLLGMVAFAWRYRMRLLALGDLMAPSLALGEAIGRIGCLLNGCCFGGACDLPWAVTFPPGSPPYVHQAEHGDLFVHGLKFRTGPQIGVWVADVEPGSQAAAAGLKAGQQVATINDHPVRTPGEALAVLLRADHDGATLAIVTREPESRHRWVAAGPLPRSLAVHPAQVYSTLNALVLCLLLVAYDPFRRRDGELTALLLTLYPVTRFLLEVIRTDESPIFGTQMSISQNVSLMFLAGMAALWIYILTRPRGVAFGYPLRMRK